MDHKDFVAGLGDALRADLTRGRTGRGWCIWPGIVG